MIGKIKRICVVAFATALAGSGHAGIYVPPNEGPSAEVTFTNSVDYGTDFVIYQEAEQCKGPQYVQSPKDQSRTTRVRAGTPTAFTVGSPYTLGCFISFRLTPEDGRHYLFDYSKTVAFEGSFFVRANCSLSVRLSSVEGAPTPVSGIEELKTVQPFFQSGSWCAVKE